ncbi:MAG TPA: glycosyltransferase family 4 protein [Terriglobales bacterium]
MPVIAYLANEFPSSLEPYVADEIRELRRRGVEVVCCSVHRPRGPLNPELEALARETLYLRPLGTAPLARAAWLCWRERLSLCGWFERLVREGNETLGRRARALLHTWLGAYYALALRERGVEHIHVHHGYFGSWVAMVAARLLDISFSLTLHGSDLLLHAAYLDVKLKNCNLCCTVSEFNRRHILEKYPQVPAERIAVLPLGVDRASARPNPKPGPCLLMLSAGRLHPVKNHAFLLRACRELKTLQLPFRCLIAGDGPERAALERLVSAFDLSGEVTLLGHLSRSQLDAYYQAADLVAITSTSEGIPLVLMEAMAHGKTVLAPAITGIPELVIHGKTGFLYQPGCLDDFVARVMAIAESPRALAPMRRQARRHVLSHFDRQKNLAAFADVLLERLSGSRLQDHYEDPVLQ